jgi:hypothetical protein
VFFSWVEVVLCLGDLRCEVDRALERAGLGLTSMGDGGDGNDDGECSLPGKSVAFLSIVAYRVMYGGA